MDKEGYFKGVYLVYNLKTGQLHPEEKEKNAPVAGPDEVLIRRPEELAKAAGWKLVYGTEVVVTEDKQGNYHWYSRDRPLPKDEKIVLNKGELYGLSFDLENKVVSAYGQLKEAKGFMAFIRSRILHLQPKYEKDVEYLQGLGTLYIQTDDGMIYAQHWDADDILPPPWKIITGIYDAGFNRLLISPELVYKTIEEAQGDLGFLSYSQGKIAAFTATRAIGTLGALGMVDVPLNIFSTGVFPPFTGG